MLQDEFQNSDYSKEDDELIIKPPQTSSNSDPVIHHKDKKKKRHSKECKSSKRHHHHHHHHRHSHKNGHLKSSGADSSKRNQNVENKSFYYKDNKVKDQSKEFNKDLSDLDIIDVRSKKLVKDVVEGDGNVVYQKITDVRHIRLVKDLRESRRYSYKEEKRNIHSFQEMQIEWKKTWIQNHELKDDDMWTEKAKGLQDKDAEKEINEHDKSLCMEHSRTQNNSVDHHQIDDEKCYSLISSEEESIDYETDKKSDELMDDENEHANDQGKNITMSDISSSDDNDPSESEKESVKVESDCENEKTVLQKESLPAESAEKTNIVEDFKSENQNSELSEKDKTPVSEEKCLPQKSDDTTASNVPVYCPAIQGCRSIDGFHVLNRIEEGTYGVVYRARDKQTKEIVALKRLKMEREKEGFPITSLREINTLLKAQHPNIVTVREIVVGSHMDRIYIVMDYVEHDLKSLMKTMPRPFLIGEVKTLLMQLLCAVAHLHDNWILHRDLKTSNLLLSHEGILKVGDFGLAREYGSPLKSYTPVVVTLWYRAPELLLGAKKYSTPIDMWSVGCIFAELLTKNALFPGKSESDQINRIFKDLGTPSEKIWPGYSELPLVKSLKITNFPYNNLKSRFSRTFSDLGFDLLNRFLTYNPARRISAEKAKNHEFFNEKPKPVPSNMFPTWPARSEQGHRETARSSPKAPIGGIHYSRR